MATPIMEGVLKALFLIIEGDRMLLEITLRSVLVSGLATIFASSWSIPLGLLLGLGQFKGRFIVKGAFNALLGLPTVTLGLILYLLFSRSGPLGFLHLLYTPMGITIGQSILITPILTSFVVNALESVDPEVKSLALTLGATDMGARLTILREAMAGVILAITASFNRAIAELGVSLMVGGNIKGITRVLTTTIALETARADISLSIALAIILLVIVSTVNSSINLVQRRM